MSEAEIPQQSAVEDYYIPSTEIEIPLQSFEEAAQMQVEYPVKGSLTKSLAHDKVCWVENFFLDKCVLIL